MLSDVGKTLKCKEGFTLIELITVIIILGIILGIGIPKYTTMQAQAEWETDVVTLRNMEKAAEIYLAVDPVRYTMDDPADDYKICFYELFDEGYFDRKNAFLKRKASGSKSVRYVDVVREPLAGWSEGCWIRIDRDTGNAVWKDVIPTGGDGVNDWINKMIGLRPPSGNTTDTLPEPEHYPPTP